MHWKLKDNMDSFKFLEALLRYEKEYLMVKSVA